eukprot:6355436-Pyramimonas_sp.AAC.2
MQTKEIAGYVMRGQVYPGIRVTSNNISGGTVRWRRTTGRGVTRPEMMFGSRPHKAPPPKKLKSTVDSRQSTVDSTPFSIPFSAQLF